MCSVILLHCTLEIVILLLSATYRYVRVGMVLDPLVSAVDIARTHDEPVGGLVDAILIQA